MHIVKFFAPTREKKETLSILILFCPVTWLWSCDITTMVPEAPAGAWGIRSSVTFFPEESQSISQTLSVLCKPFFFFLIQWCPHASKMFSGMQFRKLKEKWIYAVLVSNKKWGRPNIFSLMVLPVSHEGSRSITHSFRRARQLLTNQKRRICHHSIWTVMRSPLFPRPPKHFSSKVKCAWLCHSEVWGRQVCVG